MTAMTAARAGASPARLFRSEWTKLWSVRSTRWALLAAVIGMACIGPLVAVLDMSNWASFDANAKATYDATDTATTGYQLALMAVAVLGVLVITGEYTTGMIRSSMMAVPRRLPVIWAKLAVFCSVIFGSMLLSALVAFYPVQAIVTQHDQQHSLGDPHALRAVVGTALFLAALGALGAGIGALVRNTAGGIALVVGLLFVLPGITDLLPDSVGDAIGPYLPLIAGATVTTSTFRGDEHLAPWTGFAVFCGYAVLFVVAAAIRLRRTDV